MKAAHSVVLVSHKRHMYLSKATYGYTATETLKYFLPGTSVQVKIQVHSSKICSHTE